MDAHKALSAAESALSKMLFSFDAITRTDGYDTALEKFNEAKREARIARDMISGELASMNWEVKS